MVEWSRAYQKLENLKDLKKKSKLRWYVKAIGTESQADSKKLKVMFVWFKKQDNQISKMEHKQIKSRYKHQLNR